MVRSLTRSHLRHSRIGTEPAELVSGAPVDSGSRWLRSFSRVHFDFSGRTAQKDEQIKEKSLWHSDLDMITPTN